MSDADDRIAGLIEPVGPIDGAAFDPGRAVAAVNALVPLGAEAADVLRGSRAEGGYLVALALFVPDGERAALPRPRLGRPEPDEPGDGGLFPAFPLAVEADVPFLLVTGYVLGGEAEPLADFVARCAEAGSPRADPLRPADPVAAAESLLASRAWAALGADAHHADLIRAQAERMRRSGP